MNSWQNSLDGGSACRKAATYTGQHKQNKRGQTDGHASSVIPTHDPSV
jgi:hypothetical protein